MRAHKRAMKRHTQPVEECVIKPNLSEGMAQPYHLEIEFARDYFALVTLTRAEAIELFERLGMLLRYGQTPAREIDLSEWADTNRHLRLAIEGYKDG